MNNGKWVMAILMAGVVIGGVWMRSVAARQWDLTRSFYEVHETALVSLEDFHADFRSWVARNRDSEVPPASLVASADAVVAIFEGIQPVNGRTDRTLQLQRSYTRLARACLVRPSREATPSVLEVEIAYGALVGPVMLENHVHAWHVFPVPGAMPTPRPRRVI